MRSLTILLSAFLSQSCATFTRPPTPLPAQDPPSSVQSALDATVALVRMDGSAYCSGVAIDHRILTAAHCTDGEVLVDVAYREDFHGDLAARSHTYLVSVEDEDRDVAVLSPVDLTTAPSTRPLASVAPDWGEPIVAIGHSWGWVYTVTSGIVSYPRREWGAECSSVMSGDGVGDCDGFRGVFMQSSAQTVGGNSGGPVYNHFGEVVGLVSWGPRVHAHISFAVHLESLKAVLGE